MMISAVLNWRRNLMLYLLVLLLVGSFHSQARKLSAAWWVEQQRYSGFSFQITRRKTSLPLWYNRLQIIFGRLNNLRLANYLLRFTGQVCLYILQKFILTMINKGIHPLQFILSWSGDVEQMHVEVTFQVAISRIESSIEFALPTPIDNIDVIEAEYKADIHEEINNNVIENIENNVNVNSYYTPEPNKQLNASIGEPTGISIKTRFRYSVDTENEMKKFYNTLSEKDKRRYAGVEAMKIGHGSRVYIAELFGCSRKTVSKGEVELVNLPAGSVYEKRIRKPGGGRKPYWLKHNERLDDIFLDIVKNNTAGDPMKNGVLWTNLPHMHIANLLFETHKISISHVGWARNGTNNAVSGRVGRCLFNDDKLI